MQINEEAKGVKDNRISLKTRKYLYRKGARAEKEKGKRESTPNTNKEEGIGKKEMPKKTDCSVAMYVVRLL